MLSKRVPKHSAAPAPRLLLGHSRELPAVPWLTWPSRAGEPWWRLQPRGAPSPSSQGPGGTHRRISGDLLCGCWVWDRGAAAPSSRRNTGPTEATTETSDLAAGRLPRCSPKKVGGMAMICNDIPIDDRFWSCVGEFEKWMQIIHRLFFCLARSFSSECILRICSPSYDWTSCGRHCFGRLSSWIA